ncbi:uncharacterized protein SCHCODRAFT_02495955 [Schizophyllum commune H4-8]|uniref:Expressed protein n=1 Tax=Schizophyllum commune (strain H4-8 / FGSC 9210) TaxID=578458 RepID=D8Q2Q5_SCHCM|nr:uncharacterized protein SCHCODRAFT_02495955 [Schizophyllum commune H4-8]KAI5894558.1 hypothetical protein SCHCODRAFT_02495955 [Schizophyllum commune H4-8]
MPICIKKPRIFTKECTMPPFAAPPHLACTSNERRHHAGPRRGNTNFDEGDTLRPPSQPSPITPRPHLRLPASKRPHFGVFKGLSSCDRPTLGKGGRSMRPTAHREAGGGGGMRVHARSRGHRPQCFEEEKAVL